MDHSGEFELEAEKPSRPPRQRRLTLRQPKIDQRAGWALWTELYREHYRAAYTRSKADGPAMADVLAQAASVAKEQVPDVVDGATKVLDHWIRAYLSDDGERDYLWRHRHPLRCLLRDVQAYGTPWQKPKARNECPYPEFKGSTPVTPAAVLAAAPPEAKELFASYFGVSQ